MDLAIASPRRHGNIFLPRQDLPPREWPKLVLVNDSERWQAEIATASHNLREPLRMIRCYADLLVEQPGESAMCRDRINEGAKRLETLVDGMFECFQLSQHYHPKKVEMNLVRMNAVSRLAAADRAAITADELPAVLGDFEMLTELVAKLIDNALKFRAEPPPTIHLSAARESPAGPWRFALKDNGIGVSEEFWERCFGMFQRLHKREIPGEGFGLAYCRRAIELHGGRIWMESTPDQGTTIAFTLPAP